MKRLALGMEDAGRCVNRGGIDTLFANCKRKRAHNAKW